LYDVEFTGCTVGRGACPGRGNDSAVVGGIMGNGNTAICGVEEATGERSNKEDVKLRVWSCLEASIGCSQSEGADGWGKLGQLTGNKTGASES